MTPGPVADPALLAAETELRSIAVVLRMLGLVLAVPTMLLLGALWVTSSQVVFDEPVPIYLFFACVGVVAAGIGTYVDQLRPGGGVVLGLALVPMMALFPFGTLIAARLLYILFSEHAAEAFSERGRLSRLHRSPGPVSVGLVVVYGLVLVLSARVTGGFLR